MYFLSALYNSINVCTSSLYNVYKLKLFFSFSLMIVDLIYIYHILKQIVCSFHFSDVYPDK